MAGLNRKTRAVAQQVPQRRAGAIAECLEAVREAGNAYKCSFQFDGLAFGPSLCQLVDQHSLLADLKVCSMIHFRHTWASLSRQSLRTHAVARRRRWRWFRTSRAMPAFFMLAN